jgi:hypothetical protein
MYSNKITYIIIPHKAKNKSVFLFRMLMLFGVFGCALLIFLALHPNTQKKSLPVNLTIGGLFTFLMIYTLSGKVVREILIETEKAVLQINYFTLLSQNKVLEMPLNEIEYSYNWQPSKYPPKKYRFKIYQNNVCSFYMDSTDDGYSETQFNVLVEILEKLKIKRRS